MAGSDSAAETASARADQGCSGRRGAVADPESPTLGLGWLRREERLDHCPEAVRQKGLAHGPPNAPTPVGSEALRRHAQFFGRDGEDLVRFADRHKVTATLDLMPH